jgi:iron complex transport system substrate-binding protein
MLIARTRLVVAAATFLSLSLLATACGGTSSAPEPAPAAPSEATAAFPVTVSAYGTEVTVAIRPERIISLSPSSTEGLFAVGAGDRVIAVDESSDFPVDAPTTTLSGLTPNVEAIVAYDPDLVVLSYDPGDLVASLRGLGVPVLVLPAAETLDDMFIQFELLGAVTGRRTEADALNSSLRARIEAARAAVPPSDTDVTYFHELDDTLFTVTSQTFVGAVYGLFGLVNVADAADPDGASFGYPQLSAEFLLAADPDLVFLADTRCCGQSAATFSARPGFAALSAVTAGDVIVLGDDVASRWGPRIVDFVEQVAAALVARAERLG